MLASVIREIIAPVLREAPQECGIATITEVEVSSDYAFVTVTVSALRHPELLLPFLERQCKRLQRDIGRGVSLARVPTLRFRLDERPERGDRIDRLLRGDTASPSDIEAR